MATKFFRFTFPVLCLYLFSQRPWQIDLCVLCCSTHLWLLCLRDSTEIKTNKSVQVGIDVQPERTEVCTVTFLSQLQLYSSFLTAKYEVISRMLIDTRQRAASKNRDPGESGIVLLRWCLPVKQRSTQAWASPWQRHKRCLILSLSALLFSCTLSY